MSKLDRCASFSDFRALAKKRLPRILFDYIDGGSYSEITLDRNEADFKHVQLQQRVMLDVSKISSETTVLDQHLPAPLILGPVGFSGMYANRGEVQAAKAAKQHNVPFCLSTLSICSIEEITQKSGQAPWFQLYMIKDRGFVKSMIERAKIAGCPVLVLTTDLQTPATRYRDIRSGMAKKLSFSEQIGRAIEGIKKFDWSWDVYLTGRPHFFGNLQGAISPNASFDDAWAWIGQNFDASITWDDLDFIKQHWDGPIVVKGILTPEDAKIAAQHNVQAIVVSNHGGRQLDSAPSSISVLPQIADAVGNDLDILLDGGIRSGIDLLKAHSLGAKACLIGRAWAFALAAGGEKGVDKMLNFMKSELRAAQVLSGTTSL